MDPMGIKNNAPSFQGLKNPDKKPTQTRVPNSPVVHLDIFPTTPPEN